MSGKRGLGWRGGDRSEYLARFALSKAAFVWPVPRQEDYGVVDLACVLARNERGAVFPESAFYVQVKSDRADILFDEDASTWIAQHMSNPLYIAVVDKNADTLELYACSRIQRAVFLRSTPKAITLKLGAQPAGEHTKHDEPNNMFEIFSGPPIFSQTLSQIEADYTTLRKVLTTWISRDAVTLAHRAINRLTTTMFHEWQTNGEPSVVSTDFYMGPNFGVGEQGIAPILTALAHNYRNTNDKKKLEAILPLMKALEEHLDAHGKGFVSGKIRID